MTTEAASFGYILLDSASLVKMDEHSRISVDKATDRLLSIVVESGQILMDVQEQSPGHTLETSVGNAMMGIRGTLFVAGYGVGNEGFFVMLEGSGEIDGQRLEAGSIALVVDGNLQEIRPWALDELNDFILQAIEDHWERLIAAGIVTPEQPNERVPEEGTGPAPEPTPGPTPEPTPTQTPEPAPEPTPTPTPELTPEPAPTPTVSNNRTGNVITIAAGSSATLTNTHDTSTVSFDTQQGLVDYVYYNADGTQTSNVQNRTFMAAMNGGTRIVATPSEGQAFVIITLLADRAHYIDVTFH